MLFLDRFKFDSAFLISFSSDCSYEWSFLDDCFFAELWPDWLATSFTSYFRFRGVS